ncbi:hypothetical protein GIY30_15240 [Gordonia sp. HNM0687]|uniref:Uncharacterized protein n=1 Tax=Gordonia mangrovi TaxID=2665643 RepID=A0A6L7GVM7_9ACTN|nr:hypothetical protein [Gordonia mangrovi]MXP22695.1 hypothetical protein [Gordonia mangrovi]UVF77019.1 hypothetical protein NWF22_17040 [Gordonia mangrovi]
MFNPRQRLEGIPEFVRVFGGAIGDWQGGGGGSDDGVIVTDDNAASRSSNAEDPWGFHGQHHLDLAT